MKHIKSFKLFERLYEPISYDDYTGYITSKSSWGNPLDFSDREVNSIKSVLDSDCDYQLFTNEPASDNPKGELISISKSEIIRKKSFFSLVKKKGILKNETIWDITITKYDDEWFICQVSGLAFHPNQIFYRCDTIDGVVELILWVRSLEDLKESVDNSGDYYVEITKQQMKSIPDSNFVDIDSHVLGIVKSNLSDYIKGNFPIYVYTAGDNWIGLNKLGIRINGFEFGNKVEKWYPNDIIKWIRTVRISQLEDEWFLVSFTMRNYSIYFKCDQLDGLMRLLEDYYICESKMVKESVEEDKEILSDYFVDFEDGGGKVLVERGGRHATSYLRVTSKKNNLKENDIWVVTIFTNEKYIKGKINWKRLEFDWNILDVDQQNHRISALPKRTFTILLTRKKDMIKESNEESLAQKMTQTEHKKWEDEHKLLPPTDEDIKVYEEFMLKNFSSEEVYDFQYSALSNVYGGDFTTEEKAWVCEFEERNDDGEVYSEGNITIYKWDDEWFTLVKMVRGLHREYDYWLIDTKLGFKYIKLWD